MPFAYEYIVDSEGFSCSFRVVKRNRTVVCLVIAWSSGGSRTPRPREAGESVGAVPSVRRCLGSDPDGPNNSKWFESSRETSDIRYVCLIREFVVC